MEFRANEAFVRGLTGKEEPTSKARLVASPEPLPNEENQEYVLGMPGGLLYGDF